MRLLTGLFLFISSVSIAQQKQVKDIAAEVSVKRLQKNLYYLAGDKVQGRVTGSHGDTLASLLVAKIFKQSKLLAPYENGHSYFQAVNLIRKEPQPSSFSIGNKSYADWDGWTYSLRNAETVQLNNLPVVFAGYGIEQGAYNDFNGINVKNKAVIIFPGQPKDSNGKYLLSGSNQPATVASFAGLLKQKGAALILVYDHKITENIELQKKNAFQTVYKNIYGPANTNLPTISVSEERLNELLLSSNKTVQQLETNLAQTQSTQSFELPATISLQLQVNLVKETAPNVIGVVPGTDTAAGVIIVSAHHDHLGKNGQDIYYGAVDNASGTVAILEIARLLHKAEQKGLKPKRTIVFASYTGEEKGLLGSFYFAANPLYPIEKTWGVINIDMMGRVDTFYSGRRPDSNYAYILVKDSLNHGLRSALFGANEQLNELKLDTYYEQPQYMQRRLTGSDHFPFYQKGVPFLRIDCGFSKDYHQLTDTPDKINYELLSKQVRLAFVTAWNLANN